MRLLVCRIPVVASLLGCAVLGLAARALASVASTPVNDPVADPRAVVVSGHARFTVLTPQLIRIEWADDGKFEDRPSFVFINRRLPVPQFEVRREGERMTLRTSALTLHYSPTAADKGRFTPENLSVTLMLNSREVTWHPELPDTGNLQGTTRTLDGARGDKTREPIEPGLISRDGWTIVDDSVRPLFNSADFTFAQGGKSPWPWVVLRDQTPRQDWYFFGYGHDYRQALGDFARVAGRIPLPPRFAFGIWWSRYWAYTDQELDELVRGFRANDVPLDVFVIDMDWHPTFGNNREKKDQSGHRLGWSGYSWNRLLFPDPQPFLTRLHDEGLKVTLNLHPASGVQPWEDRYEEMARAMGMDPATKQYVPFAITDQKFATNYMNIMHHPLEKEGVDFWWLDWQQEDTTALPGVNPTWWLNYVHFTDQQRQGKRPLLFHRWGGLGNHRYQIGFSGDTISVWESLAFQPWFTATAANVGYAYWSHDIGGHMRGNGDPELYLRWIQFGAFSPILRTHTSKDASSERRIWAYPEPFSGLMREAFQLRYALGPYLYTEARRTYDTGVAFIRPLYYDWPEAAEAYTSKGEYSFGDQLIVAPITQPVDPQTQLAKTSIWIPEGEWIDWTSGCMSRGPAMVERSFSIAQIPVLARTGAIVPMQPPMRYTGEKPLDPLILTVFPLSDRQASRYSLYEDNSEGERYQRGMYRWTTIVAAQDGDELTVTVQPAEGSFPGMTTERGYELQLPFDWPPESVTVNGQPVAWTEKTTAPGWRFDGPTLKTVIMTQRMPVTERVEVKIRRAAGRIAQRPALNGFPGAIARLRGAYDALNRAYPDLWSPDELIDAMQAGNRLSYHPERITAELEHFSRVYSQAIEVVGRLAEKAKLSDEVLAREAIRPRVENPEQLRARIERYRLAVQSALALLQDGKTAGGANP